MMWWDYEFRTIEVDDVRFVQPVGFIWFSKPRYRVKAKSGPVFV